ncbi:unnamed protein product [Prunus brigantina]
MRKAVDELKGKIQCFGCALVVVLFYISLYFCCGFFFFCGCFGKLQVRTSVKSSVIMLLPFSIEDMRRWVETQEQEANEKSSRRAERQISMFWLCFGCGFILFFIIFLLWFFLFLLLFWKNASPDICRIICQNATATAPAATA